MRGRVSARSNPAGAPWDRRAALQAPRDDCLPDTQTHVVIERESGEVNLFRDVAQAEGYLEEANIVLCS